MTTGQSPARASLLTCCPPLHRLAVGRNPPPDGEGPRETKNALRRNETPGGVTKPNPPLGPPVTPAKICRYLIQTLSPHPQPWSSVALRGAALQSPGCHIGVASSQRQSRALFTGSGIALGARLPPTAHPTPVLSLSPAPLFTTLPPTCG